MWLAAAALRNLEFVQEERKIYGDLKPKLATPNVVRLDLRKKRDPSRIDHQDRSSPTR
jgi:hypothetical protein